MIPLSLFVFFLVLPVTTTSLSVRAGQIKQQQQREITTETTGSSNSIPSLIQQHHQSLQSSKPISNSVLFLPSEYISNNVVFVNKATNTRIIGLSKLQSACENWESNFQSDDDHRNYNDDDDEEAEDMNDVQMNLGRIQTLSPSTVLIQWNVTWYNPSTFILKSIAKFNNWIPDYRPYVHLSNQVSTFSYSAIFKLFYDAATTQKLRIPLACLEGTSILEFAATTTSHDDDDNNSRNTNSNDDNNRKLILVSISENLKLAQDLQQRPCTLLNRRCAQDLRLFLETARRIENRDGDVSGREGEEKIDWDDIVATKLPWSSVPGMGPLDIEETSDDPIVAVLFLLFSASIILVFASLAGPELIGQSLIGPPTYIVPPEGIE